MTEIDRRAFLRHAGMSTAALAALGGPLQGVFARGALAAGEREHGLQHVGAGLDRVQREGAELPPSSAALATILR